MKRAIRVGVGAAVLALGFGFASAQPAGFRRTELQRADLTAPGREAVQAIAEFQPGVASGRHTHPGEEIGYVLQGTVVMEVEGRPPVTLEQGDPFLIPAGSVHNAHNVGSGASKMLSTYVIEKGKALASPVR